MDTRLIAITGGIGAGKSVVSRILTALGYPVYDCDSNARRIMDNDVRLLERIAREVCEESVIDGRLDRRRLAACVFADADALRALNAITHAAVLNDVQQWRRGKALAFVESAILCESGLDRLVDEVWVVTAPEEVRIARVMSRNAMGRDDVIARMRSQTCALPDDLPVHEIVNDGTCSLIDRIESLLQKNA